MDIGHGDYVTVDLLIADLAGYLRVNAWKYLEPPLAGNVLSNGNRDASSLLSDLSNSDASVQRESPRLFRRHSQRPQPENANRGTKQCDDGRATLSLDYHQLYYLHQKFTELGYFEENRRGCSGGDEGGKPETRFEQRRENGRRASSSSNARVQPSVASTFARYFGIGGRKLSSSSNADRGFPREARTEREGGDDDGDEDALFLFQFLQSLTRIRIGPFGRRKLTGHDFPSGSKVPLTCFINLTRLELVKVTPAMFSQWPSVSVHIERIACKENSVADLADLFGDSMDLINARNDGVGAGQAGRCWAKLAHLDLSDNGISSVASEPLAKFVECRTLILSKNKLAETPSSLATLFNLRRLDLSFNLISTVQEIHHSLGNIVHLNLRGNKIERLSGVDRLWALVELDVRDNQIDDVAEILRLANLPEIKSISVRGNPLTSREDYSNEIFAEFLRRGLEVSLDGIGATNSQRLKLIKAEMKPAAAEGSVTGFPYFGKSTDGKNREDAQSIQNDHQNETASDTLSRNASIRKKRKAKRVNIEGGGGILEGSEIHRSAAVSKKHEKGMDANDSSEVDAKATAGKRDRKRSVERTSKSRGADASVGGKTRVLRLAELEDILATATTGTAGDPLATADRTQTVSQARSVSRASNLRKPSSDGSDVHLALSQKQNSTDDFRRRIEAMRLESGESWLKVFAEREQREDENEEKKKTSVGLNGRDGNEEDEQKRVEHQPVSTALPFPAFEFSRGATIRPLDSPESAKSQSHKQSEHNGGETATTELQSSVLPVDEATIGSEKADSTTMQPETGELAVEGDTNQQRALPLPTGKMFLVDSYAYESGLDWGRGKRSRRLPGVRRCLLFTDTEILEINGDGEKETGMLSMDDVAIGRPLSALLRVDGVSGSAALGRLLESHNFKGLTSVRLAFCTSRYDPVVRCDYHASEQLDELRTLLVSKAKANWEKGHADDVLKKGKCLGCGWIGFLADEDGKSWGGDEEGLEFADGAKKEKGGISNGKSEDRSAVDRRCGRCGGTFLAEFYGPDADAKGGIVDAALAGAPFGYVASNMASSFLGEAKNLFDMLRAPSVLKMTPGLVGLSTEGFFGSSKATPARDSDPASKVEDDGTTSVPATNTRRSSVVSTKTRAVPKRLEKLVRSLPHGSAVSLPPFRTAGNSLLLHLKLNIFTSDSERLLAWLPTSWVPHGSAFTPVAWKWSLMAASTANLPIAAPYCSVESPMYLALSNRAIYLFTPNSISAASGTHQRREARIFSDAEVLKAEQEPNQYLRLLHTIPLSSVARIDSGPNRQAITFHFALTPLDDAGIPLTTTIVSSAASSLPSDTATSAGSSSVVGNQNVPAGRLGPPTTSCTFLVRDRLTCSDFLNHLLVLCYDTGLHVFDNKVKLVSHDIEWAVRNVRDQVFIGERESKDTGLEVDQASDADVVIDKVSFEFIKMYYGIGFLIGGHVGDTDADLTATTTASTEVISTAPTTRDNAATTERKTRNDDQTPRLIAATIVATSAYVYLATERHDVWPPPVEEISSLHVAVGAARRRLSLPEHQQSSPSSPMARTSSPKFQRRWGTTVSKPELVATQIAQYRRLKLETVGRIRRVERIRAGVQVVLCEEDAGLNDPGTSESERKFGATASGWEVVVRILFNGPESQRGSDGTENEVGEKSEIQTTRETLENKTDVQVADHPDVDRTPPSVRPSLPTEPVSPIVGSAEGLPACNGPTRSESESMIHTLISAQTSANRGSETTTTTEPEAPVSRSYPSENQFIKSTNPIRPPAPPRIYIPWLLGDGTAKVTASDTTSKETKSVKPPPPPDPTATIPSGEAAWDLFFATSTSAEDCIEALRNLRHEYNRAMGGKGEKEELEVVDVE